MTDFDSTLRSLIVDVVREELAKLREPRAASEYLSTRRAAELADVNPNTLRRWIRAGKLTGYRAGREVRIKRVDLEKLLDSGPVRDVDDMTPEQMADRDFG